MTPLASQFTPGREKLCCDEYLSFWLDGEAQWWQRDKDQLVTRHCGRVHQTHRSEVGSARIFSPLLPSPCLR